MGTWKFTAHTYDINGASSGSYAGEVTGSDPVGTHEVVREHVIKETSAWRVEVRVDAPEFD